MIAEALQWIRDNSKPMTLTVGDKTFADREFYEVRPALQRQPVELPVPTQLNVTTLKGFSDLVAQRIDKFNTEDYVVHVVDHRTVHLVGKYTDECGRRQILIKAQPVEFKQFTFDRFLPQEDFVIGVNAMFSQTDDKDYVLKIASAMTTEATNLSEDDGLSQKVTIKAGLANKVIETVKPQVNLAPFRTFPECQQPVSPFVFRARGGEAPSLMLTEADGGLWKIHAISEIARYLSVLDMGLPIVS